MYSPPQQQWQRKKREDLIQLVLFKLNNTAKPVSFEVSSSLCSRAVSLSLTVPRSGDGFCISTVWQGSAVPTLFASPVKLTATSSSNLPSFTWMSQIIVKNE